MMVRPTALAIVCTSMTTVFAEAGVGRYCARDYDEAKGKLYKRQL